MIGEIFIFTFMGRNVLTPFHIAQSDFISNKSSVQSGAPIFAVRVIQFEMTKSGTKPGFKSDSRNYEVIFVKGNQVGIGCYLVEYLMDWTNLMEIILNTLETVSNEDGSISRKLSDKIEKNMDWRFFTGGPNLRVRIEILDQDYFPLKQTKSLHVTFSDNFQTSLIFFIRRKQVLKTLKDASLQKLSQLLKKKQNFESLGLPETLKNDLLNEAQNIWYQEQISRTTFPDMKLRRERDRPRRAFQYLL